MNCRKELVKCWYFITNIPIFEPKNSEEAFEMIEFGMKILKMEV